MLKYNTNNDRKMINKLIEKFSKSQEEILEKEKLDLINSFFAKMEHCEFNHLDQTDIVNRLYDKIFKIKREHRNQLILEARQLQLSIERLTIKSKAKIKTNG